MKQLESTDPDIHAEFMAGNFCVNKNEVPFCAIGPDHAMEHVNKIMTIQGGLKGLTQQPAAMARWFLIASELSRLSNEAETFAGIVSTKQTRHHDASPSVLQQYEQNVNKLRDILMVNDPFSCRRCPHEHNSQSRHAGPSEKCHHLAQFYWARDV